MPEPTHAVILFGRNAAVLNRLAGGLDQPAFTLRQIVGPVIAARDLDCADALVIYTPILDSEVAATIRRLMESMPAPIVVVTADGIEDHELAVIAAGAQEVIRDGDDAGRCLRSAILRSIQRQRVQNRQRPPQLIGDVVRTVLDRLPMGVIMTSSEGQVLQVNAHAERLIKARDALFIDAHGRLHLANCDQNRLLYNTIRSVAAGDDAHCALSAPRPSDLAPLSILVVPVGGSQGEQGMVMFLSAPEDPVDILPSVLTNLYGLTGAECRLVLGLIGGDRLEDLAAAGQLSLNTVRTQLKSAFRKTGTGRQAELVKLILAGPAVIRTGKG